MKFIFLFDFSEFMMCDLNFLDSYQLSLGQYRENGLSLVITTQYVLHKLFRLNPPHIRHSDKINREPQVIFKRVFYRSLLGLWKLPFISLCLLALRQVLQNQGGTGPLNEYLERFKNEKHPEPSIASLHKYFNV